MRLLLLSGTATVAALLWVVPEWGAGSGAGHPYRHRVHPSPHPPSSPLLPHPTLAAWKLLGDVLSLHHMVNPSPQHPTIPTTAATATAASDTGSTPSGDDLEGRLGGWRRRVEAMRQARRAYAKALHLDPAQAGAWQDAAYAYHHQAQLLRAHPAVAAHAAAPDPAQAQPQQPQSGLGLEGLVAAGERVARASLRLDGTSAELWAALGAVAAEVCSGGGWVGWR